MQIPHVTTSPLSILVACLFAAAAMAVPAEAQTAGPKWEVEIHGGVTVATSPTAGTTALPGPGESFTTAGIYPPPFPQVLVVSTSRRVSSWYFGDGALLFSQAVSSCRCRPDGGDGVVAPIVALDPVLGRALGDAGRSGTVGMRVTRALTARLGVEFSVDYGLRSIEMTAANRDAIEATRASFISAFQGVIASNANRVARSITSVATVEGGSAHQLFSSGALLVNLRTSGRVIPYAAAGASLITIHGDRPRVALTGNYQITNTVNGAQFDETDRVVVSDARDVRTLAGVFGGGVKYHASPRWGIRVDARIFLGRNTGSTRLDAAPSVALGQLPAGRITLNADPTIQFGNSSGPVTGLGVTGLAPSTLSGPALSEVRTWSDRGVSSHTVVSTGIFWRF